MDSLTREFLVITFMECSINSRLMASHMSEAIFPPNTQCVKLPKSSINCCFVPGLLKKNIPCILMNRHFHSCILYKITVYHRWKIQYWFNCGYRINVYCSMNSWAWNLLIITGARNHRGIYTHSLHFLTDISFCRTLPQIENGSYWCKEPWNHPVQVCMQAGCIM